MPPPNSNHWKTDPEYIDLLNFIIEKTENVKEPMCLRRIARDFKEKSGSALTDNCLFHRIMKVRTKIRFFTHFDMNTKVKLMFALSASVDADFLKQLENNAIVDVDGEKRIVYYKANDGTKAAQRVKSKRSHRLLIRSYFENKNGANAVPRNEEEKKMGNLIDFITEKCENVDFPLSIMQLAKDFNIHFGISIALETIRTRVRRYCREIQQIEFLNTHNTVQQLFGLSATVNSDYLKKLRKEALVEIDDENRIKHYKSNDGILELRGDHSRSTKIKTAKLKLESKRSYRSLINSYFENKNNADGVLKNEEEKLMGYLIEIITEKCENTDSPLNISQLTEDFNNHFGIAQSSFFTYKRVNAYCREIQKIEFLDSHSKVKQLFGLGVKLDSECLEELQKDAVVEVDDQNRITNYTSNDGGLALHGFHSFSARIDTRQNKNLVESILNSGGGKEGDNEEDHSEDESDGYSSEESDSEFDSEDENGPLNKTEDLIESSYVSEEIEMKRDEGTEDYNVITENAGIKTRYGRLSKRRHLDSNFSYDLANSSSSGEMSSSSLYSKPSKDFDPPTKRSHRSEVRSNELDDYDSSYSIEDQIKLEPFHESIEDYLNEIIKDEDIQQIPKPPQNLDEHNPIEEVTVKEEQEETVEVKPETSHNSKIKFFEAMQSLILCLVIPSLSWIQTKIHQKIQEPNKSHEVILNNEIVRVIELLIARMTNYSVENHSKNVKSITLSNFLCYLKAAILNSKLSGMEDLVKNISKLIEESQNKRISMEKVANALCATLDIDGF